VIKDDPTSVVGYVNLISEYIVADRFAEAKAVGHELEALKLNYPVVHQRLLDIAYIEGDQAAQQREIDALGGSEAPRVLGVLRDRAYLHGRFKEGIALARGATPSPDDLEYRALAGECGFLQDMKAPDPYLLRMCGRDTDSVSRAEQLAQEGGFDPDPVFQADLALAKHQYQQVLEILNPLLHYGWRDLRVPFIRGQAYSALKKPPEAAQEYHKLVARKGTQVFSTYAAGHVLLARELAKSGDIPGAKQYYQKFFELWKDADPDIPLLIEAKNEYKALQ
jgi:tetratricopeptide (TPR) repeat protein